MKKIVVCASTLPLVYDTWPMPSLDYQGVAYQYKSTVCEKHSGVVHSHLYTSPSHELVLLNY